MMKQTVFRPGGHSDDAVRVKRAQQEERKTDDYTYDDHALQLNT
jgi:hypothetical protein